MKGMEFIPRFFLGGLLFAQVTCQYVIFIYIYIYIKICILMICIYGCVYDMIDMYIFGGLYTYTYIGVYIYFFDLDMYHIKKSNIKINPTKF